MSKIVLLIILLLLDSFRNPGEIPIIRSILSKLSTNFATNISTESLNSTSESFSSVGIISLYAAQSFALAKIFSANSIQVSTVDAFQGSEKDLIILTTVRTKSIGFSADPKRLNVAISRAKGQLIIVGNRDLLETNAL